MSTVSLWGMNSPETGFPNSSQLTRSAVVSGSVTLLGCAGLAWALQQALSLDPFFVLKVALFYLLGFALVLGGLATQLPMRRFGTANQVTLARASLVAMLVGFVGEVGSDVLAWTATVTAALAAALDGLDGWLARRQRTASAFGARFDMETDALLILALSVLTWQLGKAGPWVLLSGLMRYVFVIAGYAVHWLRHPLPASRRRQTVCVVQVVTLIICLAPLVPRPWSECAAATGLLVLTWSFYTDILWLVRQAVLQGRR